MQPSAIVVAERVFAAAEAGNVAYLFGMVHAEAAKEFLDAQLLSLHLSCAGSDETEPTSAHTLRYLRQVFGVESIAGLEKLGPEEAVARYLRHTWAGEPATLEQPTVRRVFLGAVVESPEETHVVFRVFTGNDSSVVDVLTLRRSSSGWKTMLNGSLLTRGQLGFAAAFS